MWHQIICVMPMRRGNIEAALGFRRDWYKAKAEQALSQHRLIDLSREAAEWQRMSVL